MNFLEKIRKNTWFIFLLIIFYLFFFIFNPHFLLKFFNKDPNVIGSINGDKIMKNEYIDRYRFLKQFRKEDPDYLLMNDAWRILIHEKALNQQAKKVGIENTDKDFWEIVEKQSIYSKISDFRNENGKVNMKKLRLYLKSMDNVYNNKNAQIEQEKKIWCDEKDNIKKRIIAKKYLQMLMYGINTSPIYAKLNCKNKNYFSLIDYVCLPYTKIEEKCDFHFNNDDIKNYVTKNQFLYKKENSRKLSFIILRSEPSLEDKKRMDQKIKKLFYKLKHTNSNFSLLFHQLGLSFDSNFYCQNDLHPILQNFLKKSNKKIGSMFGPIKDDHVYMITKITGKKKIFHSVLFSHILISHKDAFYSHNKRSKKNAEKIVKNMFHIIKKNPTKFDSFVINQSDDKMNVKKHKGSLGWVNYESQYPIRYFNIFSTKNKKGEIGIIETKFGYHIVRIDDQKGIEDAYQFAIIIQTFRPSQKTNNLIHGKVNMFIKNNQNSNLNTLINNARKEKYETIFLKEIKNNQWNIDGIQSGIDKNIIHWSFEKERKKGDIQIFNLSKNDYIIVYLSDIQNNKPPYTTIINDAYSFYKNKKINEFFQKKFRTKNIEQICSFFSTKKKKSYKINFHDFIIGKFEEPKVIGSSFSTTLNQLSNPILGENGVYFVIPRKRFFMKENNSQKIKNCIDSEINKLNNDMKNNFLEKLGEVLIKKSKIKIYDNK
ncbi:SurA N-terminal domain-containing protein [Blattabacterium cuenoti]|uniref:SurA N-terminal domain-containing protein n=1 Tax=Blattabacterium cuenoti TaxID=1653831 RepID=UPI00163C8C9B|nr:SurA N-terminal domain-containing protein [Blattabacterium cuenoti]